MAICLPFGCLWCRLSVPTKVDTDQSQIISVNTVLISGWCSARWAWTRTNTIFVILEIKKVFLSRLSMLAQTTALISVFFVLTCVPTERFDARQRASLENQYRFHPVRRPTTNKKKTDVVYILKTHVPPAIITKPTSVKSRLVVLAITNYRRYKVLQTTAEQKRIACPNTAASSDFDQMECRNWIFIVTPCFITMVVCFLAGFGTVSHVCDHYRVIHDRGL